MKQASSWLVSANMCTVFRCRNNESVSNKIELVNQIVAVLFFRLLLNTGRRFVYPFAPFLSRGLDVPLAAVTSIIATCQATSLLGLFSGPLADRFGFRVMMRVGLAMLAAGMLLCGFWVSIANDSLFVVYGFWLATIRPLPQWLAEEIEKSE